MSKKHEILLVSKDIKHVKRVIVILKEMVKNTPEDDDCYEKFSYECAELYLACRSLSRILDALEKLRFDLMHDDLFKNS